MLGSGIINEEPHWRNNKNVTHSLQKYPYLFISKHCKCVRERGERQRTRICYIDPYLLDHVDSIFRALCVHFLDEMISCKVRCGPLHLGVAPEFWHDLVVTPTGWSWLLWQTMTVWVAIYIYIYNFIIPKRYEC